MFSRLWFISDDDLLVVETTKSSVCFVNFASVKGIKEETSLGDNAVNIYCQSTLLPLPFSFIGYKLN